MELDKANAIMVGEGYEAFSEFQEKFDILLVFNHEATEKCSQQATILGQVE